MGGGRFAIMRCLRWRQQRLCCTRQVKSSDLTGALWLSATENEWLVLYNKTQSTNQDKNPDLTVALWLSVKEHE